MDTSPFLVAKTSIKYEKQAMIALKIINCKWTNENVIKGLLIGINSIPPKVVAIKAYTEIVKDGISLFIVLVMRSLRPKKNIPKTQK